MEDQDCQNQKLGKQMNVSLQLNIPTSVDMNYEHFEFAHSETDSLV